MKSPYFSSAFIPFLQFMLTSAVELRNLRFLDDDTPVPVLIGYKDGSSSFADSTFAAYRLGDEDSNNIRDSPALKRVNAAKAKLSRTQVQKLVEEGKDDILYIEDDPLLFLFSEVMPWGIDAIQAMTSVVPPPLSSNQVASCNDPNSFKIGIVDSGLDVLHPDIPCFNIGLSDSNCIGTSFGMNTGSWDQPVDIHGTFVTGIIGAIRDNAIGVTGVLNNRNVCFIMARVFGDSLDGALLSDILDGVEWVAQQGADVVNLSLGGPTYSQTAEKFYSNLRKQNKLIFAASGNDGTDTVSYPAGFDSCVSVGAVDESLNWAVFSQYDSSVDLAAPGQGILSTAPLGLGAIYEIAGGGSSDTYSTTLFEESVKPSGDLNGVLVECPNLGQSVCPGEGGHICLIERGINYFDEKAWNCQQSGGIAAVIYNNEAGAFAGTLSTSTKVTIPVFSTLQEVGRDLQANHLSQTVTLVVKDGYTYADGTSFAAPHAAAAAAAIWQSCRSCSSNEVESCLLSTAMDLGDEGHDDYYGNGLVQVEEAYLCLVDSGCCEMPDGTNPAPTPFPTPAPVPDNPAPVLPPSPPTTGDCSSLENNYMDCFDEEFGNNPFQLTLCRSCIQGALPFFAWNVDCEKLESDVCSATRNDCPCASCNLPIEEYLKCSLKDELDCTINCETSAGQMPPATTTTTTVDTDNINTNSFNKTSTDNSSSSGRTSNSSGFEEPVCSQEHSLMEDCLAITEPAGLIGIRSGSIRQQQAEICSSSCLLGAVTQQLVSDGKQPSPASCGEINDSLCRASQNCFCANSTQCSAQIHNFLNCLVNFSTAGNCSLGCDNQPMSSISSFSSSASTVLSSHVWYMLILVGISFGALIPWC